MLTPAVDTPARHRFAWLFSSIVSRTYGYLDHPNIDHDSLGVTACSSELQGMVAFSYVDVAEKGGHHNGEKSPTAIMESPRFSVTKPSEPFLCSQININQMPISTK